MKYLYATIAFLIASTPSALAADWSLRFGPGIEDSSLTGATKAYGIRREEDLFGGVHYAAELGGYADNMPGRRSAGVAKLALGVKPGPEVGVYGFGFVGPCAITATDSYLSTNFEFCTDVGLGIRDTRTFLNVGYSHISNAGLKLPNRGKDWLVFSVGVSL